MKYHTPRKPKRPYSGFSLAMIIIVLIILASAESNSAQILDVYADYPADPYTRCMQAHENTPATQQCEYLK